MSNPHPVTTHLAPYRFTSSGNPAGLTKGQALLKDLSRELLLTDARRDKWLAAYDAALEVGDTAVILDFAYRLLGKPKDAPQTAVGGRGTLTGDQIAQSMAKIDRLLEKLGETH